jgi:hypothetical protein
LKRDKSRRAHRSDRSEEEDRTKACKADRGQGQEGQADTDQSLKIEANGAGDHQDQPDDRPGDEMSLRLVLLLGP